ncbi:MAG: VIT domain-containing protein [Planctomycetota bacterium]
MKKHLIHLSILILAIAGCTATSRTGAPNTAWQSVRSANSYSYFNHSIAPLAADAQLGGKASPVFTAVAPDEEVWIIATPGNQRTAQANPREDDTPGSGAMLALMPPPDGGGEAEKIPVPLEHTDVQARVDAYLATVDVTQQFRNPYDTKIEAVYVFPLPQNAAVSEFVMVIGERKIRGILREKEEAKRLYEQAKRQGHNASLLTQERPNIFTQKIANLEPGQRIDVKLSYFQTLAYADGVYSFVFPMVVGPRFNPPATADTGQGIGAVGHGQSGRSGQATEVSYLRPDQRTAHDINLALTLAPGLPVEGFRCHHHDVTTTRNDDGSITYALDDRSNHKNNLIPNRDFVLSYRVAGENIRTNIITHVDEATGERYFTMMLIPPAELDSLPRQPMEMVFVLDCSGSMSGEPLAQAKAAIVAALDRLGPDDTFQIIRFSSDASQLGPQPIAANDRNRRDAERFVRGLRGGGGTMMIEGIKAALDFPHDPERFRVVTFLTDGFIGNDRQIIGEVSKRVGQARIFSFGVGSSPNRYLMNRMAKQGRGAAAYLGLNDDAAAVMDTYFDRVSRPALTDVAVNFGDARVSDVYPAVLPDLFVGRPVVVTGKYTGTLDRVRIGGFAGGEKRVANIAPPTQDATHPALAQVWARQRIADLSDRMTFADQVQRQELADAIRDTALRHTLISDYTAFVAVDATRVTAGSSGVTVAHPVPVPDGVRYDTAVAQ